MGPRGAIFLFLGKGGVHKSLEQARRKPKQENKGGVYTGTSYEMYLMEADSKGGGKKSSDPGTVVKGCNWYEKRSHGASLEPDGKFTIKESPQREKKRIKP